MITPDILGHPATVLKREREQQELRGDLFGNRHAWRVFDDGTLCKWCGAIRCDITLDTECPA